MPDFLKIMTNVVEWVFALLRDKIPPVSSDASAIILLVLSVGLLALLALIAWLWAPKKRDLLPIPKEVTPISPDLLSGSPELKQKVRTLEGSLTEIRNQISITHSNPQHSTIEKLYFAINGITNSGLLLTIGLLVWEFFALKDRGAMVRLSAVANEIGRIMSVLALTIIFSVVIVFVATRDRGRSNEARSYERINKAFSISLMITLAALLIFIYLLPHV